MTISKNKITISKKEVWNAKKPRFNGYAVGHGVHGDTKYNRRKNKQELRKIISESY